MGWFLGRDTRTGELLEVPEVSAMTRFDDLSADFIVWASDGEGKPRTIARRFLSRLDVSGGSA